jgi:hypothetical protein
MASANGRLTDSELTAVYGGRLANTTAVAWLNMVAAASRDGVSLVIAGGNSEGGSGAYRDFFVQGDMKVHPGMYGLSQYSTVSIAAAGYSTHGFGTAVDVGSFPPARNPQAYGAEGQTRRDWVLANATQFGFTRTFGEADPNHFGHDGTTVGPATSTASSSTPTPLGDPDMAFDTDAAAALLAARDEARAANGNIVHAQEGIDFLGSTVTHILNVLLTLPVATPEAQASLEAIAKAVADENDRRERARLAQ